MCERGNISTSLIELELEKWDPSSLLTAHFLSVTYVFAPQSTLLDSEMSLPYPAALWKTQLENHPSILSPSF